MKQFKKIRMNFGLNASLIVCLTAMTIGMISTMIEKISNIGEINNSPKIKERVPLQKDSKKHPQIKNIKAKKFHDNKK